MTGCSIPAKPEILVLGTGPTRLILASEYPGGHLAFHRRWFGPAAVSTVLAAGWARPGVASSDQARGAACAYS